MPSGICINFATPERNKKNGNTKQKKSERNFHNEHVHNHLALSPWSIWLHATRRRVSRIIPIVLRPKRGCKIFIISCPLPGQMQCKPISRFSIFHFIFSILFLLFGKYFDVDYDAKFPFPSRLALPSLSGQTILVRAQLGSFQCAPVSPVPRLAPPTSSAYPRGISFVFR